MLNGLMINLARSMARTRFGSRIIEGVDLHSNNRLRERVYSRKRSNSRRSTRFEVITSSLVSSAAGLFYARTK
jgi:hypothetical protein